jgi:nucleotide-binding universal stress UspA family protein
VADALKETTFRWVSNLLRGRLLKARRRYSTLESNMESFRNILVDIDAAASAQPALERAVLIAKASHAKLTVVDVMTVESYAYGYLPAGIEESLVRDRRQQLARIARQVSDVQAEAKLLVGRPATVLIEEVLRSNYDLLMRSHARDLTMSGPRQFGAVDMELLRKCPCPVLLVRHGQPATKPRIACAVDASSEDPDAQMMNVRIVEFALLMANYLEAHSPILFHAWKPVAERAVRRYAADDAFAAYLEDARQRAASALTRIARGFEGRFDERTTVLRRGEPQDVIPEFVVAEGIDVLVMGTVARGGLSGMLIGNTAERVLRRLPCSVLTVKPDGFVSPVRLDTA